MEQELVICACRDEGIMLTRFDAEDDIHELYVSVWQSGYYSPSWRDRFSHIWHIIKTGHAYTDQIILDREGVGVLVYACERYLQSNAGVSPEGEISTKSE